MKKTSEKKPKKPIYKNIEVGKLRRFYNHDRQLIQAKRLARELWNLLKAVKEEK